MEENKDLEQLKEWIKEKFGEPISFGNAITLSEKTANQQTFEILMRELANSIYVGLKTWGLNPDLEKKLQYIVKWKGDFEEINNPASPYWTIGAKTETKLIEFQDNLYGFFAFAVTYIQNLKTQIFALEKLDLTKYHTWEELKEAWEHYQEYDYVPDKNEEV